MPTTIKLAQGGGKPGLTQNEALLISNGASLSKVLTDERRLLPFLQCLNEELTCAGIKPVDGNGSMKGRMLSNKEFDGQRLRFAALTGTLVAFRESGTRLGDAVKYIDEHTGTAYIFEVPEKYRKEKDCILAVNHGFLASGDALIVPHKKGNAITYEIADEDKIALLRGFPCRDASSISSREGWYGAGNRFGIPLGEEIADTAGGSRQLSINYRVREYAGLLVRGDSIYSSMSVCAGYPPSSRIGALISTGIAKYFATSDAARQLVAEALRSVLS